MEDSLVRKLVSRPSDAETSRRRVEAALKKAERGEKLTEKETMIVQWERSINSCHCCPPQRSSRKKFDQH